jgi:hypothetical protein
MARHLLAAALASLSCSVAQAFADGGSPHRTLDAQAEERFTMAQSGEGDVGKKSDLCGVSVPAYPLSAMQQVQTLGEVSCIGDVVSEARRSVVK